MIVYNKEQIEQEAQEKSKDNNSLSDINCNQNTSVEKSKCFFFLNLINNKHY